MPCLSRAVRIFLAAGELFVVASDEIGAQRNGKLRPGFGEPIEIRACAVEYVAWDEDDVRPQARK